MKKSLVQFFYVKLVFPWGPKWVVLEVLVGTLPILLQTTDFYPQPLQIHIL